MAVPMLCDTRRSRGGVGALIPLILLGMACGLDTDRDGDGYYTAEALEGTGIRCPHFDAYVDNLMQYVRKYFERSRAAGGVGGLR